MRSEAFMKIKLLLVSLCLLTGCASTPEVNFDRALMLVDKAAALAEKQGIAHTSTIRWDGKVGVSWIQRGELDSGVLVEITFHGNAAAERAAVNRP